ncbi:MAG TPA: urea carboxylase [Acidimicrobiales bacterium]
MFSKVLVANRGEIACRIIATLAGMGIASVVVYSDADADTLPVRRATEAVRIGSDAPAASYLNGQAIVDAALAVGADAIHPGYGFLAERAEFAELVEGAALVFIGPTPEQLRTFGAKHSARALAERAGVPLLTASPLVADGAEAAAWAETVGFPLMIKATAGGGGIGMRVCHHRHELSELFAGAHRQAVSAFGDGRVYLERFLPGARHVEVQVVGDGAGRVLTLGDRDCSAQRRHQKVLEESPAPGLPEWMRSDLSAAALRLGSLTAYRSAGTVEFLIDVASETVAFLEVNARLQVEHTVTEAVHGIDLVEWMVRLAAGDGSVLDHPVVARGHAIEARVCAENPWRDHAPSAGRVTAVNFPSDARVDTWIEAGTAVSTHYDSLLAKVVVRADRRDDAVVALGRALDELRIEGVATNVDLLRAVAADERFAAGALSTGMLDRIRPKARVIEVLSGGTQSTVQDHPGRVGLWSVGVPPSGPMDDLSFRLANRAVGNPEGRAGVELTAEGPRLVFHTQATICLAGAPCRAMLDGAPLAMWQPLEVAEGAVLEVGAVGPPGLRAYLAVAGGIDVPEVLGSRATFTLGGFGGHAGRALRPGDLLAVGPSLPNPARSPVEASVFSDEWELAVLEGPHADAEFLTPSGLDDLYGAVWVVHHNSARTGVRLVGPSPGWARRDGGDAGLHPSNIHDTAYATGAVDLTGDMPILLGPDGPSLGGFVCPAVITVGDRWKLGQLRPGDRVRLVPVTAGDADERRVATRAGRVASRPIEHRDGSGGLLERWDADGDRPAVTWRQSGEDYLLVEYGPMTLDLALRFRVHELQRWLEASAPSGMIDVTPGIRSLQVHVDPDRLPLRALLTELQAAEAQLAPAHQTEVPTRIVHLPLSWDDPATREAIERYTSTVRPDAPWCPWNIEFIRRINGLDDVAEVHRIVFAASYLVLGLGDVYLGAPVATPLDPRHRLVTTKYNPARTWTPENAVGIGGAYLCVYGMEGPGGYQFVGRTVPVWNRFRRTAAFSEPWLLRFFDQLRFFEVSASELLDWRRDLLTGRAELSIEQSTLRLADYLQGVRDDEVRIAAFRQRQQAAFGAERARWAEAAAAAPTHAGSPVAGTEAPLPPGAVLVETSLLASVWKVLVEVGQRVSEGEAVVVLESMKMEMAVGAPVSGKVARVMVCPGQQVEPGEAMVAVIP